MSRLQRDSIKGGGYGLMVPIVPRTATKIPIAFVVMCFVIYIGDARLIVVDSPSPG